MGHKFSDVMRELKEETLRESPEAVAEAAALEAQFKLAAKLILLRGAPAQPLPEGRRHAR
jgi:hypothetical protein